MLYKFEKYYLRLALYKSFLIINKLLSYKIIKYAAIAAVFIVCLTIASLITVYFFIGLNAFLELIHLGKYRLTEIHLFSSTFDLKPFFKK